MIMAAIVKTDFNFPGQVDKYVGKVRDVYNIKDEYLVMVVSDRISAFDVVLPEGIPYKGQAQPDSSQVPRCYFRHPSELENSCARPDGDRRAQMRAVQGGNGDQRIPFRACMERIQGRQKDNLRNGDA